MYDLIIVGGGISGLTIAYKFIESYKKVLLIESSNRLGGRIKTIKDDDGLIYEAGAGRISGSHTKTLSLLKELDLFDKLIKLPDDSDIYINNKKIGNETIPLVKEILENYEKKEYDVKLEDITFYQFCIDMIGFDKTEKLRISFAYDAEFTKMNAKASLELFKRDFGKSVDYYIISNGLESIIHKMEKLINRESYITIKKKEILIEIDNIDSIAYTDKEIYKYKNIVLTIPSNKLKNLTIFENNEYINSVEDIPLLRIYAKYPVKDGKSWFSDLPKIITNNYIRHIIPINSSEGLIMISYTDSDIAKMWNDLINADNSDVIKRIHNQIKELLNIEPPEPEYIKYYFWKDGLHVWKPSYDSQKISKEIIKPFKENIFICGESYSNIQGWIEGSLETTFNVLEKLEIEDISFKRDKKEKVVQIINDDDDIVDYYDVYDVIKNKTWVIIEFDKKYIFDMKDWIDNNPSSDVIDNVIEANKYYINMGKNPKYLQTPAEVFIYGNGEIQETSELLNRYFKKKNKFVKKIGILI